MRGALRRIHDHWFAPASLVDLAVARVAIVGFQLAILLFPWLSRGFGVCLGCNVDYAMHLAAFPDEQFLAKPALKVLMLPFGGWGVRPEPMFLHAVWFIAVFSGFGGLVGLYSRLSLLLFAATTTLLTAHGYSYGESHHPEAAITIALWMLAMGPSGARLSVDDYLRRLARLRSTDRFQPREPIDEQSEFARWPLRSVQWILALTYVSAGIAKLANGGLAWLNGYTLANHIGVDAVRHGRPLGLVMAQHILALRILSVFAVAFELLFFIAVLVPGLAWLFVLMGLGLHGGIYVLQAAPFFQTMVLLLVVFIEPIRQTLARVRPPKPVGRVTVAYDGRHAKSRRRMLLLETLDPWHALGYLDLDADRLGVQSRVETADHDGLRTHPHVVGPEGQILQGFPALRRLARELPMLWPLVPLLSLPGMSGLVSVALGPPAESRG